MREVEARGRGIPVNPDVHDFSPISSEVVPLLLDGLDRLRPELGAFADELISLLSDNAPDAGNSEPGVQEA